MADRYFVVGGVDTNMNTSGNWAASSGGAGGETVPTSSDNVFLDANSGAGNATINATFSCLDFDCTGFTGTLNGSSQLWIYGTVFTLDSGMSSSNTGTTILYSTTTLALTADSITWNAQLYFNGNGGVFTLQDEWNIGTKNLTVNQGSLDTNGQTVTCGDIILTGSNTRGCDLGASTINIGDDFACTNKSNLTFDAGTSTINITSSGGKMNATADGLTFYDVNFTGANPAMFGDNTYHDVVFSGGSTNLAIWGANTFNDLTFTGTAAKTNRVKLYDDQTVAGTLTFTGNSAINRIIVDSDTLGETRTLTAAVTSLTNVNFEDITGAGAAAWSGTSVGDCQGNTGITFTTPVTRYWIGGAGSWSDSTNHWSTSTGGAGSASVPLPQDTATFDAASFSGAGTVTMDMPRLPALDFSGADETLTLTWSQTSYIYGDVDYTNIGTHTASGDTIHYRGRGAQTYTNGATPFGGHWQLGAVGGSYTLQDAFSCISSKNIFANNGTLDFNNQDYTCGKFNSNGSTVRTLTLGSGTITLTGTGIPWQLSTVTNLTFNKGTGVIKFTDTSSSSKGFYGGGLTYYDIWVANDYTGGSGPVIFLYNNTFNEIKASAGSHMRFWNSYDQTATSLDWDGTGDPIYLDTNSAGSAADLIIASGTINVINVVIKDSAASGGAVFNAIGGSVDVSGNSGWAFAGGAGGRNILLLGVG